LRDSIQVLLPRVMRTQVHIGTSGYHYRHWRGPFYPERFATSRMLPFYVEQFDTVELNTTFYRLPPKKAVMEWAAATPDRFVFAAKGSRFITHMKKLTDPEPALDRYFEHLAPLGRKLGPIVFQLPPFWQCNLERLGVFLEALPRWGRYAFEFRNATWHTTAVYELLTRFNAAFCPWDLAGVQSPVEVTADWMYVRLHGPGPGKYQGSYSAAALKKWADRIEAWSRKLKAIFVYFDNDMQGFAVRDALALKRRLESKKLKFAPLDRKRPAA
jgi:uncharacterized protein YecE (DUF72 family)